ncbi:hypothetical protein V6N11_027117 [Hibiscus sabdariffa]|uniref:Uncharacterized protein n=1 Tax=Hibiscus sabdariffa TaxID=183260 RepID=A0ABR2PFZ8_9ROSI
MAAAIHSNKSSLVDKGCFAIYTMDKRPLVIPLVFLDNCIVILNCLPCETREVTSLLLFDALEISSIDYYMCKSIVPTCFLLQHNWKKTASIGRKRVASARANKNMAAANHSNKSSVVDIGCFAIYTMDKRPLVIQDV